MFANLIVVHIAWATPVTYTETTDADGQYQLDLAAYEQGQGYILVPD